MMKKIKLFILLILGTLLLITGCAGSGVGSINMPELVQDQNSENTITCSIKYLQPTSSEDEGKFKPTDFTFYITKNPTFDTPQVSIEWIGRRHILSRLTYIGKFGIGNDWDHLLFEDKTSKTRLIKYTNSDFASITTSFFTNQPIKFSGNCR